MTAAWREMLQIWWSMEHDAFMYDGQIVVDGMSKLSLENHCTIVFCIGAITILEITRYLR